MFHRTFAVESQLGDPRPISLLQAPMNNFTRWICAIRIWLFEAWRAWLAIAVVFIALTAVHLFGRTECAFRIAGMVFQVCGVGTVAWGIAETRKQFGHPSLVSTFLKWVARFPRYTLPVRHAGFNITLDPVTMQAYGTVSPPPVQDNSLDARMLAVEGALAELRTQLVGLHQRVDEQSQKSSQLLTQESGERARAVANILARLEATATGGLHITAIGVLWFFFGVVLGTASPELAAALK